MKKLEITLLEDVTNPARQQRIPLSEALSQIKTGQYRENIVLLRKLDPAEYKAAKKSLPTFHFGGNFKGSVTNANFEKSSGLFHFDIDNLDAETIEQKKATIAATPSCVFCFVSPSGKGLKGALRVDPDSIKNDADYKRVYQQVEAYIQKEGFTIDKSCKDVRRGCFVSYDPNIYINYDAEPLGLAQNPPKTKNSPKNKPINFKTESGKESVCINRCSNILQTATPGTRHEARLKAGKLAGGYIAGELLDESKAHDILMQLSDSIADNGRTTEGEKNTILDAIKVGKKMPIYESRHKKGERGETLESTGNSRGRTKGEKGRKLGEFDYQSPEYPIQSLGPLAPVCETMSKNGQIDPAICGQALLGAVSLCTQGLYEVETLAGIKPTSLYLLSIADSGDGKSTAESISLHKVREHDKKEHLEHKQRINHEAKKPHKEQQEIISPYRLCNDATAQGIIRSLKSGFPSQGVFTAEGAVMLCGWGMSSENKLNTAGNLNRLWDGEPVSIMRGAEGRTQLYDRRFCAHWLIQPDAAQETMNDPALSTIGMWPRFLIGWPEPLKPRLFKPFNYHDDIDVQQYWKQCENLLSSDVMGLENECSNLKTIPLDEGARNVFIAFFESMEQARNSKNNLNFIKNFAVRTTENACRIAGNLAAYARHESPGRGNFSVTVDDARNAIELVRYSLETWRGIFGTREDREHEKWALDLYNWLCKRPDHKATETAILKTVTPKYLRSKHKRDVALSLLNEFGMVEKTSLPNEWQVLIDD